jgi:adenylate kinase
MKKLRDQGRFLEYCQNELLLEMSLKEVAKRASFIVSRPAPEASGGTTSETVMSWLKGIPKLVIIGPHYEGLSDNNSTFMIRMLTDRYNLVFNTEKDVIDFVRGHIDIFRQGRKAIRQLIKDIKKANPYINDRPKPLWDDKFENLAVIIQGPPGAGKDTQGRLLQDLCGFKFFGSGFELRQLRSKFPSLKTSLEEGNLAPSWLITNLITQKLIGLEKFEPIVFAGTPKMLIEAKLLLETLESLKRKPLMIVLDISEELARERIVSRRVCEYCEISFCDEKLVEKPVCPQCGRSLEIRNENKSKEAVEKIFSWYKTDVEAVIRYFEDLGLVTHIDGNRSIEEIFQDILEILKK